MADLTDAQLVQLAYEASNASLKDYDPRGLKDSEKAKEDRVDEAPKQPVHLAADNVPAPAPKTSK